MKAAVVPQYDLEDSDEVHPASLIVRSDWPVPSLHDVESRHDEGDVLVQVAASSVNPIDSMLRRGYGRALLEATAQGRSRLPFIPGFDVAGTVVDVGTGVWNWKKGDMVWGGAELFRNGAHAEYIAINQHALAPKPANLTMEEAGSLPFVALTSWRGLVDTAGLSSSTSKRIFINGGSGGIGVFSIQLLKSWGHYVVASCGERNVEKLTKLGCDQVLDYRSPQFQQFLDTPESVDVVLDTVGGAKSEARGLRVVKPGGHYLSLRGPLATMTDSGGLVGGLLGAATTIAQKKLAAFTQDRRHVHVDYVIYKPNGDALREVGKLVEMGRIKPDIDRVFDLGDIREAHQYLEGGHARGKVVIKVM